MNLPFRHMGRARANSVDAPLERLLRYRRDQDRKAVGEVTRHAPMAELLLEWRGTT